MKLDERRRDEERLRAVVEFAHNVLTQGRDRYRAKPTPLLADGLKVDTGEHITWRVAGGREIILSNLASQQVLLRVLTGLSNLTGEIGFKAAGEAVLRYHFAHLTDSSGLLQWGGHRVIDLKTLRVDGPENKGLVHELKNHFPFYDLMFAVNPAATRRLIGAIWNAHLHDWANLELSRHGRYGLSPGLLWEHPFHDPPPFRETRGLSFLPTGNDLIYAAGRLYKHTGYLPALVWAKRLAWMFVKARHPQTRLGVYQYTQALKQEEAEIAPEDPRFSLSCYGDRAKRQLGPELGPDALEGNMLLPRKARSIYVINTLMELELAEELGAEAREFVAWVHEGMLAYAKYAYLPETNQLKPMLANGTDLSGYKLPRSGYYGRAGTVLQRSPAGGDFLHAYARTYRLTGDPDLWTVVRQIGQGLGLGDLGFRPGDKVQLALETREADYRILFALLEIYRTIPHRAYLALARRVGDNILRSKFRHGYFLRQPDCLYAEFNAVEPLALLALEATIRGTPELVPGYLAAGYLTGDYEELDGTVHGLYGGELYERSRMS
ncbi:MAG: pectate lyase [Firmicutes bacterium]|nr:pectate lyase [Bacillota bacterium]